MSQGFEQKEYAKAELAAFCSDYSIRHGNPPLA